MLRVTKPEFFRGDRTAVPVYKTDKPTVDAALRMLQRHNPELRLSLSDAMTVLINAGWAAMQQRERETGT